MLKRIFVLCLSMLMVLGLFSACGNTQEAAQTTAAETAAQEPVKVKKVLTLGHSLAVDAGHMLALIAAAEGCEELIVGTLYYSGCPLNKHVSFLKSDAREYNLYLSDVKDTSAPPTIMNDVTMGEAIRLQDWDLIIMQGGVFEIGEKETYLDGNIQVIQEYVNDHKLKSNAIFAWNMAWAPPVDDDLRNSYSYEPNSYINNYKKYNDDRSALYQSISNCVSEYVETDETFSFVIPSATVMENALSSYLTEKDLHRDYVHASDLARVMVSYTWYCRIAGIEELTELKLTTIPKIFLKSTQLPEDRVLTEMEQKIILEAVNNALKNPYEMTQSQYTTAPEA